jgi:hypothetical protein
MPEVLSDFGSPRIEPSEEWLTVVDETLVEIHPKTLTEVSNVRSRPSQGSAKMLRTLPQARPKISKVEAVSIPEAVEILRSWRGAFPDATHLNGRRGSDSQKRGNGNEHWLHIRVDGYGKSDRFQSRHGPLFNGSDYNGIVNFHADTKASAIDHFIELIEQTDDYHDVLRPWATYETITKPTKHRVRPKFALQGYSDGVEGFFLYHDGWK